MAREFTKIDTEKGRIEFLDSRYYQHPISLKFYPSVTTVLEAYPKSWAYLNWLKEKGKDADEIRDEAGRKGSVVHQTTEDYDRGKTIYFLDENGKAKFMQIEWAMFERYVDFRTRFPMELLANEVHYISELFEVGGTLDRVFKHGEKNILLDIKTGAAVYDHYWLQQSAYAAMYEEQNDIEIHDIAILHLNASTRTIGKGKDIQGIGWKLYFAPKTREHYFNLFQHTKALWDVENENTMPRNLEYKLQHTLKVA